jgi:filamentous hemagglutinin family protein
VGTNLFHSFGLFNINTGESATFTGPAAIDNVVSRVTGGSQSFIDGLLRSEIESANLWFINPAGVLFGQHASLDIQGSFHVSTADYLKLGDGGRFEATNSGNSVLTVAPPEAFGFLGERQPSGIAVQGSRLQVPDGETLSVVGGDIRIADGTLYAPGGRIDMVSVASPGEVLPNAPDLGVASFERLGRIEVSHASSERPRVDPSLPPEVLGNEIGNVDASGAGGGRIFIRGGELVADNAFIFANTRGSEEGQGIDIGVTGQVTVRNGALITADTFGSGSGGDLAVKADKVLLSGDSTGILARALGDGSRDSGDITVTAGSLEVRNGAGIHTARHPQGEGGDVTVTADRVLLSGDGKFLTGISSGGCIFNACIAVSVGSVGNVTVTAGSLKVHNGAGISAQGNTSHVALGSTSRSGSVTVTADRIFLSGDGANSTGITADGFEFDSFGPTIDAGNVTIQAGSLEVRNGAEISASFFGNEGHGGNVTINATDITLQDGGRISAEGIGAGQAGQIFIKALDSIRLVNGSQISVATAQADAGDITLEVGDLLHLRNGSRITTSVAGGTGKGGNITLNSVFVVLDEGSSIIANALEGQGGNILIRILGGGALFKSPDSRIEASSEVDGLEGSVVIDAPDTDIIAGFAGLPANFLDAATVLTQLCAERSGANVSSLVVRKYEVLPDSPYALRVHLPRAMPTPRTAKQSCAPRTYYAGSPLRPIISCLGNG